ncbi:TrkH family potassium uptake protein [Niallia sp. NCCP-28]|uniref:TrkH family potassium uptake protein n=1 Tax=Niallia sp. NCCP-28 TaxID=2934712 RepID=UPI00207DC642|nr:TrkH family potassium uptake protein [Niallia sp. NCCP-28]GKU82280.1 Ktr system potassium uptake protein D [Niallia sp. NCCP-28]
MWKTLKDLLNKFTPAQIITGYYLLAVSVSVLLLCLPGVHQNGVSVSFADTVFTAVSAVSVTGLTVINISETYSTFGIFILMFILQFGGIGVMTLGTFFWMLLRKKIGLKERQLIMLDHNQSNLSGLVNLIREIIKLIIIIEAIGALILGLQLRNYYPTWTEAFLHGLFASISATTNGGLDLTGSSLMPYADDYFIQLVHIILITLGAIGFPVLIEVKKYLFPKNNLQTFRFSLFTKLTTLTFGILLTVGTLVVILLEWNHYFSGMVWHKIFFNAFFHSASTRSGGLSTMDLNDYSMSTLLIFCFLMFVGASPSSVGGGIRTTTLALNIMFIYHFAKGSRNIKIFKREIHEDDVIKSLVVTILASGLCIVSIIILSITEKAPLINIIFEVCSAFGTTGLSLGLTPDLSTVGKIVIIILMFIGRIGLTSFIFIIGGKEKKDNYHYPKERIIIG